MSRKSDRANFEKLAEKSEEQFYDRKFEQAEATILKAIPFAEAIQDEEPFALAGILNSLAGVYRETGRDDEALEVNLRALALAEKVEDCDVSVLAGMVNNVAQLYRRTGHDREALPYFQRALEMYESAEEPDHVEIAMNYIGMTEAYSNLGDERNEEEAYRKAVEHARTSGAVNFMADYGGSFAEWLVAHDRIDEAGAILNDVIEDFRMALKKPRNIYAVINPEAMAFELEKDEHKKSGAEPADLLMLRIQAARLGRRLGKDIPVVGALPPLSPIRVKINGGENNPELGETYQKLGVAMHLLAQESKDSGEFGLAEDYYRKSLGIFKEVLEPGDEMLEQATDNLRELLEDTGRDASAV